MTAARTSLRLASGDEEGRGVSRTNAQLVIETKAAGIPRAEIGRLGPKLRDARAALLRPQETGFLRVLRGPELSAEIRGIVRRMPSATRDIVQLGIGGSSLGAQALLAALGAEGTRRGRTARRTHLPDNVDPEGFGRLLEELDPQRTLVHVVSKSGGTLETQAQLSALRHAFGRRFSPARQLIVTTGSSGSLRDLAEREGATLLTFPDDVAGRYSVLTASGLLLPALCGVPIDRVLCGARSMAERCRRDPLGGPAGKLAAIHYLHDVKYGRAIHVEMIYADALLPLGDWFRQIWAESLGKAGRGPTPVTARGTTDQHSQIQLYAEGPDDKLYTLVRVEQFRRKVRLAPKDEHRHLAGRELGEVMEAEVLGTREALRARGRPLVEIRFPRITPEAVGELILLQQLQTALAGALYGVDPFTQPGVDAGKRAAMRILSRAKRRGARATSGSRRG
jgi:glucose-6-phosphate isomerase